MRRSPLLASALAVVTLLTACGSSDDAAGDDPTTDTVAPDGAASDDTSAGPTDSVSVSSDDTAASGPSTTNPDKPKVSVPASAPTELAVSELRAGDGAAAADGDTVVLDYIGVRAEDGTEFDNSWDRGEPFTVVLGSGQVISGWDQGLVGVKPGGQYQLDIPSDLAYGDQGAGETIKPGDALTFVVDVRAVLTPSTEADEPAIEAPTSSGATEVTTEDLVDGQGAEVIAGQSIYLELIAFRGDTGEQVDSSWGQGGPWMLVLEKDQTLAGLIEGIPGMKVGGRRLITIPAEEAFGAEGSTDASVPANTDLIVVIDAVYAY